LIIGNNVLAQVPDLNDFVSGMVRLLKPNGVITLEFPHLQRLMEGNQFDTIYHEHFSYFSLTAIERLASRHDLKLIDVEELPTHGGSLRVYLAGARSHYPAARSVVALLDREEALGYRTSQPTDLADQVRQTKRASCRCWSGSRPASGSADMELRARVIRSSTIAGLEPTFSISPSIAILTSTGSSRPGCIFRFFPWRRSTRPSRTTSSFCHGT
jgi:hypothetical protein